MNNAGRFSLSVESGGEIIGIVTDTLDIGAQAKVGMQFPHLVVDEETSRALSFLTEINALGSAFDWPMKVKFQGKPRLLHFTGYKSGENLIIIGAEDPNSAEYLFREIILAYNEKTSFIEAAIQPKDADLYDQISRMNNELTSAHRGLAKKIAQLANANAQLKKNESEMLKSQALLEQRVQERTLELQVAYSELEKSAHLKDEFLANMSHELRTPLAGILGMTEVIRLPAYGPLSEKQKTAIDHIQSSGQRLLEIINNILDLSMIEAGKVILTPETSSLNEICQTSMRMVAKSAAEKRLDIDFCMQPENIVIKVDGRRLTQILVHLLDNAIKFTLEEGNLGIQVIGSVEEKIVYITVWDTGIGIHSDDISRLFRPFVQLDASLARRYPGAGVGLALARGLTELHGGKITIESTPESGSRFTISLPWER